MADTLPISGFEAVVPGKSVRVFVSDEARIGPKGTLTRVWAPTGSRPTLVKDCEYDWLHLWAAVDPATRDAAWTTLDPARLRSLCRRPRIERAVQDGCV
jgi:hypothetical protein